MRRPRLAAALLGFALAAAGQGAAAPLRFTVAEGAEHNEFFRDGPVAAHLATKPGVAPRVVVAFPAGNSGVGLWFAAGAKPVAWRAVTGLAGVSRDGLHGIVAELDADTRTLTVERALLSSVRVLRDYHYSGKSPAEVAVAPVVSGRTAVWRRPRLDGGAGYELSVEALGGSVSGGGSAPIRFAAAPGQTLRLRVTALSGDAPLTPIPAAGLFTAAAAPDPRLRDVLGFLAYGEKLNAGSWRYNTYFGRDTLMSIYMLSPAVTPAVMEAGLGSVLDRLNRAGEVAHEEDIGEFAVLAHRRAGKAASDAPVFDYKMVDDDYMLAPVIARYLLEPRGRARAAAFLARRAPSGETYGAALVRNLRFVLASSAPFARAPKVANLIALKPGVPVGDWRDSEDGLAGGRYSYNVNGVFVPAALDAVARLAASGLLDRYGGSGKNLAAAAPAALAWTRDAPPLFDASVTRADAATAIEAFARAAGVDPKPALAALPGGPVRFRALALEADGRPIPIVNSDEGFALLFTAPSAADVETAVDAMLRPFPAGLLTGAGLVVANPVYAGPAMWPRFDRTKYHGAVIWSWQQALVAAGLTRQLERTDLPAPTRDRLRAAQARLWEVIEAGDKVKSAELWSWRVTDGRYVIAPYGQSGVDQTESNAAQLWSTVYLGVRPPPR